MAAIEQRITVKDFAAIASFNLLGLQSESGVVDLAWMKRIVSQLRLRSPGPETDLLGARLADLQGRAGKEGILGNYLSIAASAGERTFAWTGVKDRSRLDSFFDPFGNLTVAQRAMVEAARLHSRLGRPAKAEALKAGLRQALTTDDQRAQVDGYWARYIVPGKPPIEK